MAIRESAVEWHGQKNCIRRLPFDETMSRKTLIGLELKLKDLKKSTSPFKTYVNKEVPMLENIAEYYKKSDGKTKKKILGCIFSKKLVFEKGKVATYKYTIPIQVLLNASEVFKKLGTKKEVENDLLSCVAPLTVGSCNQIEN